MNWLIICYTFPPYSGIGGRRWAKFSKYLNRKGQIVKVISGIQENKESHWNKDVLGIDTTYLPTGYPKYLGVKPTQVREKLLYRISLFYNKLTVKGNYYDRSAHWGKILINQVEKEIDNGVDVVVVSIAPFRMAFDLIPLIKKYPSIKWVVDFRDPWVGNETSYGYTELSSKRKIFEQRAEKEVLNNYDLVISVADKMTNDLGNKLAPKRKDNFLTIYNGFDPEELKIRDSDEKSFKFSVVFAGTIYNNVDNAITQLNRFLARMETNSPSFYNKINFYFLGADDISIKKIKHPNIHNLPKVTPEEVYSLYARANMGLILLSDDIDYSFSTKFIDYLAMGLPMLVVSKKACYTGEFVEKNGIGVSINDVTSDIIETDLEKMHLGFNRNYPQLREQFNIEFLTDQLLKSVDK